MKLKLVSIGVFLFFICLISPSPCSAVGDATQCVMTVKKIELKNRAGDWLVLTDEEQPFDLFSQNPAITVVNKGRLAPGVYVNCRITLSETFTFAGSDGPNMTKEGGQITVGGTAARASELPGEITSLNEVSPTWNTQSEGIMTEHLNLNYEDRDEVMAIFSKKDFTRDLVVKEGSTIRVTLRLDLKKTVYYVWADYFNGFPKKDTMYFLPPKDVSELSVKADAVTALATSDIEWTF